MKTITIEGQLRTEFGKRATNQVRSGNSVPCVIYGGASSINFHAPVDAFKNLIYTSEFQQVKVVIGDKSYNCVLKDLQFHRITDQLIHADFLELIENKNVTVNVPIKFVGTPEGVKAGGKLLIKMKSLKIKALPKHLVENVEINIDALQLNKNIRVEDIKIPNIEITNSARIPIASVVLTRQLKQEEKAAVTTPTKAATPAATPDADKAKAGADKAKK